MFRALCMRSANQNVDEKKKISEIEGYEGRGCIFAGYCNFNRKNFFNQTRIERYFC